MKTDHLAILLPWDDKPRLVDFSGEGGSFRMLNEHLGYFEHQVIRADYPGNWLGREFDMWMCEDTMGDNGWYQDPEMTGRALPKVNALASGFCQKRILMSGPAASGAGWSYPSTILADAVLTGGADEEGETVGLPLDLIQSWDRIAGLAWFDGEILPDGELMKRLGSVDA